MPTLFNDYGYSTNEKINLSFEHIWMFDHDYRPDPEIYHIRGRNESYIIPKVSNNELTIGYNDNNISIYNYLKTSFRAVDNPNFLFLIISDNNDKNWINLIRGIIPHKNKKIFLPEIFKKPYNNDIGFHLEILEDEKNYGDNYEEYLKEYVDNFYVLSQNGYLNKIVNFPLFITGNKSNFNTRYSEEDYTNLYNILKSKIVEYGEKVDENYYHFFPLDYGIEIYLDYILIAELLYYFKENVFGIILNMGNIHSNGQITENLIEWDSFGEYLESNFKYTSSNIDTHSIPFRYGMTWRSFCMSEYNTIGFKIYKNDDKEYVGDENGNPIYDLDDNLCLATDSINSTYQYYNVKIFPLHVTTWKDDNNDIHGSATTENKKLYDYYIMHCKKDTDGVNGETILFLNDNQNLYINNTKITHLYQDQAALGSKFIIWDPYDDSIDGFHIGGIYSDGKIYMRYDG